MQKSLYEFAGYLAGSIPEEIPEDFKLDEYFTAYADEGDIREGVRAFRDFLYRFFDMLKAHSQEYDHPIKPADKTTDTISIAQEYPFIRNTVSVLIHIGIISGIQAPGRISVNGRKLHAALKGARVSKVDESISFLEKCGLQLIYEGERKH